MHDNNALQRQDFQISRESMQKVLGKNSVMKNTPTSCFDMI